VRGLRDGALLVYPQHNRIIDSHWVATPCVEHVTRDQL